MMGRSYFGKLPITRYGKPMAELLLDYINHQNNRTLTLDQLLFEEPIPVGDDGLVELGIRFATPTGWDQEGVSKITYMRQPIVDAIPDGQITIHLITDDELAIRTAIYEQYGFYLDEGAFTFTGTDSEGNVLPEPDPEEPVDEEWSERWYRMDALPGHLLLEGYVPIRIVKSIEGLGTTISRLLDVRQYYTDIDSEIYPIELYVDQSRMTVETDIGSLLWQVDETDPRGSVIAETLITLTGDPWVCVEGEGIPFNVFGYTLLYNGLRNSTYNATPATHPYVMAVQLNNVFCNNLSGVIQIGYRNDVKQQPGWAAGRVVRPVPLFTPK